MFRSILWKLILLVMLGLAVHVHQHSVSPDGASFGVDCVFCHAFGQPLVAAGVGYVLGMATLCLAWVFSFPQLRCFQRYYRAVSRGPPLYRLA